MDQRWMSLNHRLYESQLNGHGFLPSLNTNMWIMNPVDRVWSDAVAGMDSWWLDNTGAAWCSRRYRGNKTQTCRGRNHQLYCIWIAKFSYTFSTINETIKHNYVSIPQFDVNKIITTLFYLFNSVIWIFVFFCSWDIIRLYLFDFFLAKFTISEDIISRNWMSGLPWCRQSSVIGPKFQTERTNVVWSFYQVLVSLQIYVWMN